jgi:thiol-disulfide isomerase/thioredoxin
LTTPADEPEVPPSAPSLRVRADDETPVPPPTWRARLAGWAHDLGWTALLVAVTWIAAGWLRAPTLPATPPLDLPTLDGGRVRLTELRGRTVVVNFWATWCGPCRMEMPTLVTFAAEHPDVAVVLVAVDGTSDALRAFAQAHDVPEALIARADGPTREAWGVGTLPTTVVVGPDGALRGAHGGIVLAPQLWWWTR